MDYPHGTQASVYRNLEPAPAPELSCSVCGSLGPSLAELEPCSHLLCSACLTSALNIVGEKDMECAVCKTGVANFHLRNTGSKGSGMLTPAAPRGCLTPAALDGLNKDDLANDFHFFDLQASSTPNKHERHHVGDGESPVLRIDNVPWVCIDVLLCQTVLTQFLIGYHTSHGCRLVEASCQACACPPRSEGEDA